MIQAITEIGKYVLVNGASNSGDNEQIIQSLVQDLELIKKEKKKNKENTYIQRIIKINFDVSIKKIEIDFEQVNSITSQKYSWIGNTIRHKLYCTATTDNIDRILTSTIFELKNILSGNIVEELDNVYKIFFQKKEVFNSKQKKLTKHIINYKYFNLIQNDKLKELYDLLLEVNEENKYKEIEKNYLKLLKNEIIKTTGLTEKEISLYTIMLNKKIIAQTSEYKTIVIREKIDELFSLTGNYKDNVTTNGLCSVCGKKEVVTSNFSSSEFKFYINDKLGFSSNLDGKFIKNFNICKECYQYLIAGENFIKNNLSAKIGLKTYIIPKFIFKTELNISDFAKYLLNTNNKLTNLNDIREFEGSLEQFKRFEKEVQNYLVNYLFYVKSKSEFKVLKLIKDIPPTRLNLIRNIEDDISNLVDNKFDAKNDFKIALNKLWLNIPVKKKNNQGYSKYLELLDNLFSDINIDYNFLINQFTEVIRIVKFENENYNIKHQNDLVNKVIQQNFILLFFKKLEILGGIKMDENTNITDDEKLLIPKHILDYFASLEVYNDCQKRALFLLGYLIGEIGNRQQTPDAKKKPILNKINFQGMDYQKLIRLTNDIFEKLEQYKILNYNEDIFSSVKLLIEKENNWKLSNQESVFYVLSGYAFSNYMMRKRSKDIYNELLNKARDIINELKENGEDSAEFEGFRQQAIDFANNGNFSKANKELKKIKREN